MESVKASSVEDNMLEDIDRDRVREPESTKQVRFYGDLSASDYCKKPAGISSI